MVAPQGWYDPSDEQIRDWLTLLEGTLAEKWRLTRNDFGTATWTRMCGEYLAAICDGEKPDTLRGLTWLQKWANAHGYV